jgi:hypothetical protein
MQVLRDSNELASNPVDFSSFERVLVCVDNIFKGSAFLKFNYISAEVFKFNPFDESGMASCSKLFSIASSKWAFVPDLFSAPFLSCLST